MANEAQSKQVHAANLLCTNPTLVDPLSEATSRLAANLFCFRFRQNKLLVNSMDRAAPCRRSA